VSAGVLLERKRFTVHTLGWWWSAVTSRAAGYASGMRVIVQLTLVMWCVGEVNGQFKKRVRVTLVLLWNELPFHVESLDVKLLVRG